MILFRRMIILIMSKRIFGGNTNLAETTNDDFKSRKMNNIVFDFLKRHIDERNEADVIGAKLMVGGKNFPPETS